MACDSANQAPDIDREHEGPAGDGGVGAACSDDTDCLAELICVREAPGGLCTRSCNATTGCPTGTNCIAISFGDQTQNACLPACRNNGQCRSEAGYTCVVLDDGVTRVCWY